MGADGGVVAVKRKYMRHGDAAAAERVSPDERARLLLTTCAVSGEALREPVVVCQLGRLYNKEAVLTRMVERSMGEAQAHIRSSKDLLTLSLTPNPAYQGAATQAATAAQAEEAARFVCPITGQELNGHQPFVAMPCGCVLSDRALRELPSDTCLKCSAPVAAADAVPLAPTPEVEETLRARVEARRAEAKRAKRAKKAASSSSSSSSSAAAAGAMAGPAPEAAPEAKRKRPKQAAAGAKLPGTGAVAEAAAAANAAAKSSAVYASLFRGKEEKKMSANALFATVAAARYNLS